MADRSGAIIGGVILIVMGVLFLAAQFVPDIFGRWFTWPMILIGMGGAFLLWAILSRTGGLAIPGCIVGGLGLIFYWQNATGNWDSWTYIWTLIPGFVGIGVILSGTIDGNLRQGLSGGLFLVGISLLGFLFFGGMFGLGGELWRFWPVILIVVGLGLLIQVMFRGRDS